MFETPPSGPEISPPEQEDLEQLGIKETVFGAPNLKGAVGAAVKGVRRAVADIFTGRRVPKTRGEWKKLAGGEREASEVMTNAPRNPVSLEQTLRAFREQLDAATEDFSGCLRAAKGEKARYGEVPSDTLRDLGQAQEVLQNSRQLLDDLARMLATTTQEKTRKGEKLAKIEKKVADQRAAQEQKQAKVAADLDAMKDLLRKMGEALGLNDFSPPSSDGFPPPRRKEMSPSMDERKTGREAREAGEPPIFTITPPLQGYYREAVMDSFDKGRITWREEGNREKRYPKNISVAAPRRIIKGSIKGGIALPLPAGYLIDERTLVSSSPIKITWDDVRGIVYMESSAPQDFEVSFGKEMRRSNGGPAAYHTEDIISGRLSPETERFLAKVKSLPPQQAAVKIAEYVQERLEYSNESAYNAVYKSDPSQYFQKIEQHGKADCDVANGFFAALCRRVGIPARLVVGHHVAGSHKGVAEITSGTGHAWAEIWDGYDWKTIDATPPKSSDEDEDGEKLDTGNPQEGVDLKTNPKPKQDSKSKEKALKEKMEAAREKNEQGELTDSDLDEMDREADEIAEQQEKETADPAKEGKDMLEEEARILENQGRSAEAEALRKQAEELQKLADRLSKNPQDTLAQQEMARAMEKAAREAAEKGHRAFLIARIRHMVGCVGNLIDEAVTNKEEDIL